MLLFTEHKKLYSVHQWNDYKGHTNTANLIHNMQIVQSTKHRDPTGFLPKGGRGAPPWGSLPPSENNRITIKICITIDFAPLKKFLEESQPMASSRGNIKVWFFPLNSFWMYVTCLLIHFFIIILSQMKVFACQPIQKHYCSGLILYIMHL